MSELIAALRVQIGSDFGAHCVGHALDHLDRVRQLACEIGEVEGGERTVIEAACLLHDYHRVVEHEGHDSEDLAEARIRHALDAIAFPEELVQPVIACIAFTDRYSFAGHDLDAPCLEAKIVRDADNLDALGAVGIARAFMFGGKLGEPLWVDDVAPQSRYVAGPTSSVLHHFFEKLLRLREDMLTVAGAAMAGERHEYMLGFLSRLQEEWNPPGLEMQLVKYHAGASAPAR